MKEVCNCPKCGGDRFIGNQTVSREVIVDGSGNWLKNIKDGIYDTEIPNGPFVCKKCGAEYDQLPVQISEDEVVENIIEDFIFDEDKIIEAIDEAVHDLFSNRASEVNNGGVHEQLKFLVGEMGEDEVKRLVTEAQE